MVTRAYVCYPYTDDSETNKNDVRAICKKVVEKWGVDVLPIAPQIYFNQFIPLDHRETVMTLCKDLISMCDEVWVFDHDKVSLKMVEELDYAAAQKIPIVYMPEFHLKR